MSIYDAVRSQSDILNLSNQLQAAGLVPIFRVVTQNSFHDTEMGTKLLIDTVPVSMRANIDQRQVRYDDAKTSMTTPIMSSFPTVSAIASDVKGTIASGLKSLFLGSDSIDERGLKGFEIESTTRPDQPWPKMSGIFNVRIPLSGDANIFTNDLIRVGFPIWVYMGYMDKYGNVISHPSDTTKYKNIPLVFGGFVTNLKYDKTGIGARMLIEAAGYNWYLDQFTLRGDTVDIPKINIKKHLSRPISQAFKKLFSAFESSGGNEILPLYKNILRINESEFPVRYIYGAHADMVPINISNVEEGDWLTIIDDGWTFADGIRNIERIYDVDVEWDRNGYLMVHGRNEPLTRITKQGESGVSKDAIDERVHDIIVGGNVIDIEHENDVFGMVNNIEVIIKNHESLPSNSYTLNRDFIRALMMEKRFSVLIGMSNKAAALEIYKKDDFVLFPGRTVVIDLTPLASEDVSSSDYGFLDEYQTALGRPLPEAPPVSPLLLVDIFSRLHYWGMRGSAKIVGNPFIRAGDLLQVVDISTDRTGTVINLDAVKSVLESITDKLDTLKTSDREKLLHIEDRMNPDYGLGSFSNIYYVWKVVHYLGEKGFWSRIFYTKDRHAPISERDSKKGGRYR